ncbi:MAG: dihydrofolate reductase family protein [Pseudorhodobacter sp.]|nr:dihydrofolate reductase family protein [Pseudorhodobacter sp.]
MRITAFSELTIDGRMTLGRGQSSTQLFEHYGAELRHWFHAQRAAHDAIMVGAGTVRTDNPRLTVRHAPGRNPLRIVPTNDGLIPADSHILTDGFPTVFAVPESLPTDTRDRLATGSQISFLDCGANTVDLKRLAQGLAALGLSCLMAEGGSRLLHGLFGAGLVDRIVIKHIPVICGAVDAPTYLAAAPQSPAVPLSCWQAVEWRIVGGVGISIYEPKEGMAP